MRQLLISAALSICLMCQAGIGVLAKTKTTTPVQLQQQQLEQQQPQWSELNPNQEVSTDVNFKGEFPDKTWWEEFQDPYLNQYIQTAVNQNLSLSLMQERVKEARALAKVQRGREFPQLSLGANASRQRNSATILRNPSSRGIANSTSSSSPNVGSGSNSGLALGQAINYFSLPLTMTYETDFWHKNRDRTRAANKQTDAALRDYQAAQISLVTDVASAYFNLMASDQMIAIQKNMIEAVSANVQFASNRLQAGLTSPDELMLVQGQLNDLNRQLQDLYQVRSLALHKLAVLMGKTTSEVTDLKRAQWEQYALPADIQAGIPSELLARRPDILAAQDRLEAAGLVARAAKKELLPSINLSGQFGFASAYLDKLFNWQSYLASVAASAVQPIFTGGQAINGYKAFQSRYQQQILLYRDTTLQAFREADDAIAMLKADQNSYEEQQSSVSLLKERFKIQENRLSAGAITDTDVNVLRLTMLQSEQSLADSKLVAMTDMISLYKALGGGY